MAPEFLTTKEVAELLRIKERKIYELAGANAIPVSRVTGKLLFPRDMIEAWVRRNAEYSGEGLVNRPTVLAGSHDPLLDWALRESGSGIASFFDGSLDGLKRLASGGAIAAGLHIYEPERQDWNREHISGALVGLPIVLLEWARRRQGLILPAGNPKGIGSLADLDGLAFIARQPESGSHLLLEHLAAREGVDAETLIAEIPPARSETDVALAVADSKADAGFAIEAVARQLRLDFVPLFEERYDLAIWRREYFEPPLQRLMAFCRGESFARRAAELGGYDITGFQTVHLNNQ